ncbi:helix-turn-helix domain-containing protein [Succinimonas amylolytica]|uniref:helix-turn-helix domain-containing protein n=1 Tax=Succinimonas amylolytica TaxID=83769 RepID=UPI00039B1F96|nr:helix-turn-helix transcriptional regulator [Succinimonas amylolytica]
MDGDTIRHIRELLKMNQDEFAAAIGYSKSHLCLVENHRHPITMKLLTRVLFVIRGAACFENSSPELRIIEQQIADLIRK